jgi:hypothetical protein
VNQSELKSEEAFLQAYPALSGSAHLRGSDPSRWQWYTLLGGVLRGDPRAHLVSFVWWRKRKKPRKQGVKISKQNALFVKLSHSTTAKLTRQQCAHRTTRNDRERERERTAEPPRENLLQDASVTLH